MDPKSEVANETPFWTVCPYCYYMFEYEGFYRDCALLCQNQKCRRAYTAVPIPVAATPPPEVADSGKYVCLGFVPTGGAGDMANGWKWWHPFVSMGSSSDHGEEAAEVGDGGMVVYNEPRA